MKAWHAHILTAFPQMFPGPLGFSNVGKGLENGLWSYTTHDLRRFAENRYASIDDTPYGGGAGMVICPQIIAGAMDHLLTGSDDAQTYEKIYLSPRGKPFTASVAKAIAGSRGVILLCGRYEGVDQRAVEHYEFREISLGDYVISSGELASFVLIDATVRLLQGILGASESLNEESFEQHLLEYPHFTRPATWRGLDVPEVLLSGHHQRIADWRLQQSCAITRKVRPDLYERYLALRQDETEQD